MRTTPLPTLLVVALGLTLAAPLLRARVDVQVEFDKAFDFGAVRTWTWAPGGRGQVKLARTVDDDPDAMRADVEPIIVDAVTAMMKQRGLAPATDADLTVTYYLPAAHDRNVRTDHRPVPASNERMGGCRPLRPRRSR